MKLPSIDIKFKKSDSSIFLLASISLSIAWFVDRILPEKIIVASLYLIPILIVASYFKTKMVGLFTFLSVVVFSFEAYSSSHHFLTIILHDLGMTIVGVLTIQLNKQKIKTQELKEDVENAKNQLEVFMNIVAHDLIQPLTSAKLYSEAVVKFSKGKEKEISKNILTTLKTLEYLIYDLRDASRIGGKITLDYKKINLSELLIKVISEHQITTTKHKITLLSPKKIIGWWDEERIKRVFTNLLSNAIKYTPNSGVIKITAVKNDKSVLVSVKDKGIGLTKVQNQHLFQPFIRQYKGSKHIEGSGLGLYICKSIVKAHKGRIWVKSKKGKGSTFFVKLPVTRD